MASCRGRTEAFARHVTCRLKNLETQIHESTLPENTSFLEELDNGAWLKSNNFQNENHGSPTVSNMQSKTQDLPATYLKFNCKLLETVVSCQEKEEEEDFEDDNVMVKCECESESDSGCSKCIPITTTTTIQNSSPAQDVINGLYISNSTKELNKKLSSLLPSKNVINACQTHTETSKLLQILGHNEIIKNDKKEQQQFNTLQNGYREKEKMAEAKMMGKRLIKEGTIKGPMITITTKAILTTETGTTIKNDNQYSDDNEEDERPQRVRRCSSLKTGKTPPGTPSCKKIVRFADALGLDLADIKTYLDDIPTIPLSAYEDLQIIEAESITYPSQIISASNKLLMPLFHQPISLPNFIDMVKEKFVILENAVITDSTNNIISGCVRVRNLDFHKTVHIRYSLDDWRSYIDLKANYMENSCDGFSDKFLFTLYGNTLQNGQRLEFAIRFQCKGQQYWDNNYGTNYCFQCLSCPFDIGNNAPIILSSITNTRNAIIRDSYNLLNTSNTTDDETWCNSFY